MPRRPCYWTRKLELELVEFVKKREFIWKSFGNTNHHIQQKYKAYAEFAAKLGRGFTARSVRDRWVNIRSTFNHNLRRVDKSKEAATTPAEVYIPCWPLWKPLQFLRDVPKKEDSNFENYPPKQTNYIDICNALEVKEEVRSDAEDTRLLNIRERGQRTDRPRHKTFNATSTKNNKCIRILDDLIRAMNPLSNSVNSEDTSYWFFGKHVTERLNCLRQEDAECASRDILMLLDDSPSDLLESDVTYKDQCSEISNCFGIDSVM